MSLGYNLKKRKQVFRSLEKSHPGKLPCSFHHVKAQERNTTDEEECPLNILLIGVLSWASHPLRRTVKNKYVSLISNLVYIILLQKYI